MTDLNLDEIGVLDEVPDIDALPKSSKTAAIAPTVNNSFYTNVFNNVISKMYPDRVDLNIANYTPKTSEYNYNKDDNTSELLKADIIGDSILNHQYDFTSALTGTPIKLSGSLSQLPEYQGLDRQTTAILDYFLKVENSGVINPNQKNLSGTSATGSFQITKDTRAQYAPGAGVPTKGPLTIAQEAKLMTYMLNQYKKEISRYVPSEQVNNPIILYIRHQLGLGGFKDFITGKDTEYLRKAMGQFTKRNYLTDNINSVKGKYLSILKRKASL
ncbi:MAG: hypothetical protein IE909_05940 [Campylobacterales bacterium]|nr:hypothetical protein [Campylobacterales bacterium]